MRRLLFRHARVEVFGLIFVRNAVNAMNAAKKIVSPHFIAFLTKIHREIHRVGLPTFTESDLNSQEKSLHLVTVCAVD